MTLLMAIVKDPIPYNCVDNDQFVDTLASQLNSVYDVNANSSLDIETIIDHYFVLGLLELEVACIIGYTSGNREWHPIALVKIKDLQAVANYILHNDFEMIHNDIERQ